MFWTCVVTHRNEEGRAAYHIEAQRFRFYLPLMWAPHLDGLRRERLFPGYLFVRVGHRKGDWGALANTRGVKRLMMTADDPPLPARIPNREIDYLISLEDDGAVVPPPRFKAGDYVEITGGKRFLVGSSGVVKDIKGGKVMVILHVLGHRVVKKFAEPHLRAAEELPGMAALAKGMDREARARLLRKVVR